MENDDVTSDIGWKLVWFFVENVMNLRDPEDKQYKI